MHLKTKLRLNTTIFLTTGLILYNLVLLFNPEAGTYTLDSRSLTPALPT